MATTGQRLRFLSTLPARGATAPARNRGYAQEISIHAPREGSDTVDDGSSPSGSSNFYPRSPRGERRVASPLRARIRCNFYPRSPRGERLQVNQIHSTPYKISIHAPREGSDARCPISERSTAAISIHAPREGSDRCGPEKLRLRFGISIHAPREGSDWRCGTRI